MKVCVLMKQVPDKNASLKIAADNCSIINENITLACNESDNYALEEALLIKEKHGGEVVACTLGQQTAPQILKDAMAKGADRSIFIPDEKIHKSDISKLIRYMKLDKKNKSSKITFSLPNQIGSMSKQKGLYSTEIPERIIISAIKEVLDEFENK